MNSDEEGLATKEEVDLKHDEANTVAELCCQPLPVLTYGQVRSLVPCAKQLKASWCGRTVALLSSCYATQSYVPADRETQVYCLSR